MARIVILSVLVISVVSLATARPFVQQDKRILAGVVLSQQEELVPSVVVVVSSSAGEQSRYR